MCSSDLGTMARLKEQYVNEIAPALNSKFGYKSVMPVSYTHLKVADNISSLAPVLSATLR